MILHPYEMRRKKSCCYVWKRSRSWK